MSGRDRMVLMGVVLVAVLGAAWMLVVSPERKKAGEVAGQIAAAQSQLASAESSVVSARAAQSKYAAAYASLVGLGKAVPATQEVPALIVQLAQATSEKNVDFNSITASSSSGTSGSAADAAAAASFAQLPFTFTFEGSYFDLEHLFSKLTDFANTSASGEIQVSGRLLTIESVKLSPAGSSSSGKGTTSELSGTITATAYTMPATQGVTGGATTTSPLGATTPASTTAAASSPTPAAIVKVNP